MDGLPAAALSGSAIVDAALTASRVCEVEEDEVVGPSLLVRGTTNSTGPTLSPQSSMERQLSATGGSPSLRSSAGRRRSSARVLPMTLAVGWGQQSAAAAPSSSGERKEEATTPAHTSTAVLTADALVDGISEGVKGISLASAVGKAKLSPHHSERGGENAPIIGPHG